MKIKITTLTIGLTILSGCSSNSDMADRLEALENQRAANEAAQLEKSTEIQQKEIDALPEWVLTPPASDSTGFYGVGISQTKPLKPAKLDDEDRQQ